MIFRPYSSTTLYKNVTHNKVNVLLMWIFSSVNLLIDFVNIYLMGRDRYKKKEEKTGAVCCAADEDEKDNLNMLSAFTHVIIDTLRSLAVMVAALMASVFHFDPDRADAIAAVVCSVLTFVSTFPLFAGLVRKARKLQRLQRAQANRANETASPSHSTA